MPNNGLVRTACSVLRWRGKRPVMCWQHYSSTALWAHAGDAVKKTRCLRKFI